VMSSPGRPATTHRGRKGAGFGRSWPLLTVVAYSAQSGAALATLRPDRARKGRRRHWPQVGRSDHLDRGGQGGSSRFWPAVGGGYIACTTQRETQFRYVGRREPRRK